MEDITSKPIGLSWKKEALDAIHIMVEAEVIEIFRHSVYNMAHSKRKELMGKDWELYLQSLAPGDPLVSGRKLTIA